MNASALTFQGAVAGVPELQTFLDTYVCQANANQSACEGVPTLLRGAGSCIDADSLRSLSAQISTLSQRTSHGRGSVSISRLQLRSHLLLQLGELIILVHRSPVGGVEPYWGLFDEDRNLKDVTIPDCPPGDY